MTAKEKNKFEFGIGGLLAVSVIYIVFGLFMLLVPSAKEVYVIYIISIVLIAFGIYLIARYFLNAQYKEFGKYGFSGGVLAVIAGCCLLIRAGEVSGYFSLFIGACILVSAIIKLQNAVALGSMRHPYWMVFLVLALVFVAASVIIILNPKDLYREHLETVYYILIADGAVGVFSILYMSRAVRTYKKNGPFHRIPDKRSASPGTDGMGKQRPDSRQEQTDRDGRKSGSRTASNRTDRTDRRKQERKAAERKDRERTVREETTQKQEDYFPEEEDILKALRGDDFSGDDK